MPYRVLSKVYSKRHSSSVIRQKGESENGGNKKNKADQIFRKTNISHPLIRTHFCIIKDQLGL